MKTHWTDKLVSLNACDKAIAWCRAKRTAASAWRDCKRGDWLLWIAAKLAGPRGSESHRAVVLAACGCARLAIHNWHKMYPDDKRAIACIETTERWARGEAGVTLDDVRAARRAAAYSPASYAVSYAVSSRAYAAAYTADPISARSKTLARCADVVRRMIPMPRLCK
jgi:hypothetical protein